METNEFTKEVLTGILKSGTFKIKFIKQNGDEREMVCTLNPDLLPEKTEGGRTKTETITDAVAVYLPEEKVWRSFNICNLITVQKV